MSTLGPADALLIFPPGWTAYAPYLALPALAAAARRAGHRVDLLDLNVEYYDSMLSGDYLRGRLEACRERLRGPCSWAERRRLSAALAYGYLVDRIDDIKAAIRERTGYPAPSALRGHLEDLTRALYIAAAPTPGFKLLLNRFELPIDVDSLDDLTAGTRDRVRNPFIEYYEGLFAADPARWQRKFIGISVTSETQLLPAYTLATLLRARFGDAVHICFGGNFITRFIRLVKEPMPLLGVVDSYVLDEGEETLVALLGAVEQGGEYTHFGGVASMRDGQLRINSPKNLDVDALPTPDFEGMPLARYFSPRLVLPVYSSRGCFAKCTFCSIPAASGGGFRVRSAAKIVADMKTLSEVHGTEYFTFIDETLRPAVMQEICVGITAQNLKFRWYGETRFGPQFTEDFAQLLYDGGCRKLQFGLESYNQRVLNLMRKGVRLRDMEPSLRALFSKGIAAHLFFMVGFPTETEEEARRTNEFTNRMVRASHVEYDNPFTTRGFDVFALDPLAPAYSEPEYHQIRLVLDDDSRKVTQRIDYRSGVGMQPEEAQRLVDEFRFGVTGRTTAGAAARSCPGQISLEEPEELNFLASCWRADRRTAPAAERSAVRMISPLFGGLRADSQVFEGIDLLSPTPQDALPGATSTLFCPTSKAWMVIDSDLYERAKNDQEIPADVGARLEFFGFGKRRQQPSAPGDLELAVPLAFLDACTIHDADAGRSVTIVVHATGQVVKVSALVFFALRLADGTRSLGEIGGTIAETIASTDPRFIAALRDKFVELSAAMLVGFVEPSDGASHHPRTLAAPVREDAAAAS